MTEEELPMFNLQRQETKHAYEQDSMKTNNELLVEVATQDVSSALKLLETTQDGLSKQEASRRLSLYGPNEIAHNKMAPWYIQFLSAFKNPFIFVLLALGALSFSRMICKEQLSYLQWYYLVQQFGFPKNFVLKSRR